MTHHYGYIPDSHDKRDLLFAAPKSMKPLPPSVDLCGNYTNVYDQGALGSCTANAIAMAICFEQVKQKQAVVPPSRLMIYYEERHIEDTIFEDSGAQIRDGIKSVANQGVCPETEWPYDIKKFKINPPLQAYINAQQHTVKEYRRLNNRVISDLKQCLADGFPFVFGFTVYESFESEEVANTGIMPMPKRGEKVIGGHAVICLGYDDSKQVFKVRNSWSKNWALGGHFYMPYKYMTGKLVNDCWEITLC